MSAVDPDGIVLSANRFDANAFGRAARKFVDDFGVIG
jgi:hypothetical protein